MGTMLIRGRYKVVRVVALRRDYALLEAVDISDRETPLCLLNLYEGELLHRYSRIFTDVPGEECPAFRGIFLEQGTLVAAFDRCEGESIDRLFYRGDAWDWRDRLSFAELLLHRALSLANLPPELACAALLSENLLFDLKNRRVGVRWMAEPMEEMNPREAALLAADQVKKILPRTPAAGREERTFLDELETGAFRNVVALYGRWRSARPAIEAERGEFESKDPFRRGLIALGRLVRDRAGRGGLK